VLEGVLPEHHPHGRQRQLVHGLVLDPQADAADGVEFLHLAALHQAAVILEGRPGQSLVSDHQDLEAAVAERHWMLAALDGG